MFGRNYRSSLVPNETKRCICFLCEEKNLAALWCPLDLVKTCSIFPQFATVNLQGVCCQHLAEIGSIISQSNNGIAEFEYKHLSCGKFTMYTSILAFPLTITRALYDLMESIECQNCKFQVASIMSHCCIQIKFLIFCFRDPAIMLGKYSSHHLISAESSVTQSWEA